MIIKCRKCGWKWNISKGGYDPYICHKCGMNNKRYYNNKNIGDIKFVPVVTSEPMSSLVATAIATTVASIFSSLQRPAGKAREVIAVVKEQIKNQDARTRLATVIGGSKQNFKSADVDVNEMLLWYRENYPNDYMELTSEDKMFWNTYLDTYRERFLLNRPDLQEKYLNRSYFTWDQINYKPETPGTQKAGFNMWITLALVGAGIFALSKMKK
jgi:hypothetical protein